MANTLTTLEKATVDDDTDHALNVGSYSVVSSDPAVASVNTNESGYWFCYGNTAGTATLTATRNADGETATVEVTVEAPALPGFEIHLGAHSPK